MLSHLWGLNLTDYEIFWVKSNSKSMKDLLLGSDYMPHHCGNDITELDKSPKRMTENNKQKQLILCGDFICPDVPWDTCTTKQTASEQPIQQAPMDITHGAQLSQVHSDPTRQDKLDLEFTTNRTLVTNSTSMPGISDHDIIITDFDTCPLSAKATEEELSVCLYRL